MSVKLKGAGGARLAASNLANKACVKIPITTHEAQLEHIHEKDESGSEHTKLRGNDCATSMDTQLH
jgi:hypothetical protein